MHRLKFNIHTILWSLPPSVRKEKRQQIALTLNITRSRLSTILHYKENSRFDFNIHQAIAISSILECSIFDLYNTKVVQDYKIQFTNNLVNERL